MNKISCLVIAVLVSFSSASIDKFPSNDIFHPHCMLTVTYPNRVCSDVFTRMGTLLDSFGGSDPNNGKYTPKEQGELYYWLTRTTDSGKQPTDVAF